MYVNIDHKHTYTYKARHRWEAVEKYAHQSNISWTTCTYKWPSIIIIVNLIPYWSRLEMSLPVWHCPHGDQSTVSVTDQPLVLVSYWASTGWILAETKAQILVLQFKGHLAIHHCPFVCSITVTTEDLLYAEWNEARLKKQQQEGNHRHLFMSTLFLHLLLQIYKHHFKAKLDLLPFHTPPHKNSQCYTQKQQHLATKKDSKRKQLSVHVKFIQQLSEMEVLLQ